MGYMGFGLQKWIYTMKPRKPFKKRSENFGYETNESHERRFKLKEQTLANPERLDERINKDRKRIKLNIKLDRIHSIIYIISLFVIAIVVFVGVRDFGVSQSQENYRIIKSRQAQEKERSLSFLLKSGIYYLNNTEIESAIKEFELALGVDPTSSDALYYYVLSLSVDCELSNRNCERALEFFEKLKKIDNNKITEELEVRIVIVEEKMKNK
jgi:tetratricopeptide (TPR) repeat protein